MGRIFEYNKDIDKTAYMNWRTKMMYLTIWLLLFDAYDAVIVIQRKAEVYRARSRTGADVAEQTI